MAMLLAFAPFIVFAIVDRLVGVTEGLFAGTAISAAMLLRDWIILRRTPKILEIGTTILFGGLALYAVLGGPTGSIMGVRLAVDCGLLAIVLVSMAIGQPFTLQYARDRVAREHWQRPEFIRANTIISAAWALAFVVLVLADLVLLYAPGVPPLVGIIAIIAALLAASKFTGWYPAHLRSRAVP
jgi:hypothetical protein